MAPTSLLSSADLSEEQRAMLERAAEATGCDLKDFVLNAVFDGVERALAEDDEPPPPVVIKLSERDSIALAESLLNPKGPSDKLRAAAAEYMKYKKDHGL